MKLIIVFTLVVGMAYGKEVTLDIGQITSFFDANSKGTVNQVAFSLSQLESFHEQLQNPKGRKAKELTKKYLKYSYPKGSIPITQIAKAKLPNISKAELLKANGESLLIDFSLEELWSLSPTVLNLIPTQSVQVKTATLSAKNIEIGLSKFKHNLYYSTFVRMHDVSGKGYLFSSPSEENLVAEGLDKIKNNFPITFINSQCSQNKCVTTKNANIFSSFKFDRLQISQILPKAKVLAQCNYENIYRREYHNYSSIEVAYNECILKTINREKPKPISPLLKRLYNDR